MTVFGDGVLGALISQINLINVKDTVLAQMCFMFSYFLAFYLFCFHCLDNYSCHVGMPESFKMHFNAS